MLLLKGMSKELWKLSKLLPGLFVVLLCAFSLLTEHNLPADAYLAEDRIYYGADSYNINYKDEVINAKGNAYFRRANISIRASRIVIHYGKNEKRAYFYDNVRLHDTDTDYTLIGDYGEGYFNVDHYFITGNVVFTDEERKIAAQRAETEGLEEIIFTDNVFYSDEDMNIASQQLTLWKKEKALFQNEVHAMYIEKGDEIFCGRLAYHFETGDQEFKNEVLYIQRERTDEKRDPFIIRAELVQYDHEKELYLLMDRVFATDGIYSLRGALVKYFREREALESIGNTVINDGLRTVYTDRLYLDVQNSDVSFMGASRGVFDVE